MSTTTTHARLKSRSSHAASEPVCVSSRELDKAVNAAMKRKGLVMDTSAFKRRKPIADFSELAGKTIAAAQHMRKPGFDDEGYLRLTFTDKSACVIQAYYGGYTGKSEDEYPTYVKILANPVGLEPVN